MTKIILAIHFVLLLFCNIGFADDCKHSSTSFHCVTYLHAHDGDTITVKIPEVHPLFGEKISVRVRGIDTPEVSTKDKCEKDAGRIARNLAESLLKKAKRIDLVNVGRDKYFRILADVKIDGQDLSEVMLKNHLAYRYNGGTKQHLNWCERKPASVEGQELSWQK